MVLISNVLIEGSSTPYVNTHMVEFAGDFDTCKKYNWCRYLIQCLQEEFVIWNQNREKRFFKGSLAFLMFFSFGRILGNNNKLPKIQPSFRRWPNTILSGITLDNYILQETHGGNDIDAVVTNEKDNIDDNMVNGIIRAVCEDILLHI
ncbi:hypothetical protein ACET3Z_028683 [Daucus carota]